MSYLDCPPLAPTSGRTPLQQAVLDDITSLHAPETFLWIVCPRPDGSAVIRYSWTRGGAPLGDRIDQLALAAGLDAADWLHIGDRHSQPSTHGRIKIEAYPLRRILADVQSGVRIPEVRREGIRRVIESAAEMSGHTTLRGLPRWVGVGPTLLARSTHSGEQA
ncbi:hypothetical protein ACIRH0_03840 [Streptomyces sp. NPDC093675]|uniref:hypothetical protein n=1 Tax=Streptomyces sp. NPDC093675 TaxID=3366049 RepID=UPI0037F31C3A